MNRSTTNTDHWPRQSGQDGLAVSQVFGVLRRSWAWIAVPTLLAAVGAGVFVEVVPPRYTGEAKVLLESRDPSFTKTASERGEPNTPIDEQAVASQVQVAMSRDLAREAIRSLKLVGNPEFDPSVAEAGPVKTALRLLGLAKNPASLAPEERVLEAYYDRLLVYPVGKARILAVEFRSKDPELAAKGANTVSELYISSLAAASVDTARYASTWLGTNIDGLRAKVSEAEAKVEAFRAKHGLIAAGGNAGAPLSSQQLGELSSQLTQARTIKADLASKVKLLKDMIKEGRAFEIPDVANNELIRRTVESRITLRAQLALEARTLLPQHPRIKELTAQVTDLEAQIKAAAERIVRTMENDARIADARVVSLQGAVDGQSDVVVKGNGSEVQLRALEREAKVQREQLENYLSRFREARARDAASASPGDARIVSRAVVPETPSFPKKIPTLAVATVLAFLLSSGGVIGRHLLRTPPAPVRGNPVPQFARQEDDEPFLAADPTRTDYPEPFPPEHRRGAAVAATFDYPLRASAGVPAAKPVTSEEVASVERHHEPEQPVEQRAAPLAAPLPSNDEYDFDQLIERLEAGPSHGGRCVLVLETVKHAPSQNERSLSESLAGVLSGRARTLRIDVGGGAHAVRGLGLTDLVVGEAEFSEVIHATRGARLHTMRRGLEPDDVLLAEPEGVAISLNALAQAYDWVVCRLDATRGKPAESLLSVVAASMDAVVIVSNAQADDAALVDLFRLAEDAGAGQVLVAHDHRASWEAEGEHEEMELRLSA